MNKLTRVAIFILVLFGGLLLWYVSLSSKPADPPGWLELHRRVKSGNTPEEVARGVHHIYDDAIEPAE